MKKRGRKLKKCNSRLVSKNEVKEPSTMDSGFSSLVDGYTLALEDNSAMITTMLEELATRKLSKEEKNTLSTIGKELEKIDRSINKLK